MTRCNISNEISRTLSEDKCERSSLDRLAVVEDFEGNLSQTGEDDVNDSGIKDEMHGEVDKEDLNGKVTECTAGEVEEGVVEGDG